MIEKPSPIMKRYRQKNEQIATLKQTLKYLPNIRHNKLIIAFDRKVIVGV